jgi:hypothetical protein
MNIQVFEPPMCCTTGVCGPSVDPALPRFAADLEWLKSKGVNIERFNLSQQPASFAHNPTVRVELGEHGNKCLPLILVDCSVASRGEYPTRSRLAQLAGLAPEDLPYVPDNSTRETAQPQPLSRSLTILPAESCCSPGKSVNDSASDCSTAEHPSSAACC